MLDNDSVDEAITVLSDLADAGDWESDEWCANLLVEHGRMAELRVRADAGAWNAGNRLAALLADQDRVSELRARADSGDRHAARRLAGLFAERGEAGELRTRMKSGDGDAARQLADLLARQGHIGSAVSILQERSDIGDIEATERLSEWRRAAADVAINLTINARP
ncbi:MAG TPA: hypothetical protein VF755_28405 [Catenuloplanes sp.]